MKSAMKIFHFQTILSFTTIMILSLLISDLSYAQFKITTTKTEQFFCDLDSGAAQIMPLFRYNRVQGSFFGATTSLFFNKLWRIKVIGSLGYGFEDGRRYHAEVQKPFLKSNPLTLGFAYYDEVRSLDEWFISHEENSLAAFLLKEDFMDYFGKSGMLAFLEKQVADAHTIRFEVDRFEFEAMARKANWALLGSEKKFRGNPPILKNHLVSNHFVTSIRLLWALDFLDSDLTPNRGWSVEGIGEQTIERNLRTQGLFMTLKCFQPTFESQLIKMKVMVGVRKGCDQRYGQYLMDMGGIGSLVAYRDKEFQNGNRFLYATIHYLFNGEILRKLMMGPLPLFDQLSLGLFAESGWLHFGNKNKNPFSDLQSITLTDIKSDVGLSLYITEEFLRVDFAKRTDRSKNDWRITMRLMQKF